MESVNQTNNTEASNLQSKVISSPECDSTGDSFTNTSKESSDVVPNNITFKLIFNKQKLDITWNANESIASLKNHIHNLTNVPPAMQKLMFRGKTFSFNSMLYIVS